MILTQGLSRPYPYATTRCFPLLGEREERSDNEVIGEVIPLDNPISIVDDCL